MHATHLADILPAPAWTWGVFTRLLGVVYAIAFASLRGQVVALAGRDGVSPVAQALRAIAADFSSPARFVYFPTLLWFGAGDRALRAIPTLGVAAGLWVMLGAPCTPLALALCWALYLSLDVAVDFERPWDTLLLEAGLLAVCLPPLHALPTLAATSAAPAAIGWAYRWLLFRVMVGFGKQKFARSSRRDLDYLQNFFVNQPMPTPLGYLAHRLPRWMLRAGLAVTFVVEIVLPALVFFTGWPRLVVAAATAGLMVAIQLTGSYSFFNLLVAAMCVTLLDVDASVLHATAPWRAPVREVLADALALVALVGGLVYLPFNHWVTRTVLHWSLLRSLRAPLRAVVAFFRGLVPFHVVHAYGVFPPNTGPAVRVVPVLEGSRDGVHWAPYVYRFQPATEASAPRFTAPYQPFFDFTLVYEGMGHNLTGLLTSISGIGNPYRYSRFSALDRMMERLLEGSPAVMSLFASCPFGADAPPVMVRARLRMLIPTTPAERAQTGAWWTTRDLGLHAPPTARRPALWDTWLPDPATFHPDEVVWKRRAPAMRAVLATNDVTHAGVSAHDVATFWDALVPSLGPARLDRLMDVSSQLRARFDDATMRRLERVMGALTFLLTERLASGARGVDLPGDFHRALFAHHVVGAGRAAFDAALANPSRAAEVAPGFTLETGLFHLGVFRVETLRFHAQKLRVAAAVWGEQLLASPLRGVPDVYPLLARHFVDASLEGDLSSDARAETS